MTAVEPVWRRARQGHWIVFFALILAGWAGLFGLAVRRSGVDAWILADLCRVDAGAGGFAVAVGMWALMAAAMMAPTFLPALVTYDDLIVAGAGTRAGFAALFLGFGAVWLGFAVLAALVQWGLAMRSDPPFWVTGLVLVLAGGYQFSPVKSVCLDRCRSPLTVFMTWLCPAGGGAFRAGLRMGLDCLGCCWALMALGLLGGAMSLLWMGIATVLMVLEKLPRWGGPVTHPLGAILIGAGVAVLLTGLAFGAPLR